MVKMKKIFRQLAAVGLTLACTVGAIQVGRYLWNHYTNEPWTRDGRIRADILQISPDVSGLLTDVRIKDNQTVTKGEVLFVVDRARHELAVRQAEAQVAHQRATLDQARREARRNHVVSDLVASETVEAGDAKVQEASAALAAAESNLSLARLNLSRTTVTSPADGYLNDRAPHVGDYVTAGRPVLSVVDRHAFHVDGYFEENKLTKVRPGQVADILIMGESKLLHGHVQSIAAAIEDRDRSNSPNLLPNVNPTFNWVRLAQRIPVRITLDQVPDDIRLIVGRTATVSIRPETAPSDASQPGVAQ